MEEEEGKGVCRTQDNEDQNERLNDKEDKEGNGEDELNISTERKCVD